MADAGTIPAWILLFTGLYSLAAGIGEFRQPGLWKSMLDDFARTSSLRFLTGIVCLTMGAAIYLVNPWVPGDWMSVVVTVLGGWIALEGLLFLAVGDQLIALSSKLMGAVTKLWAIFAVLIGIAAIAAAMMRL